MEPWKTMIPPTNIIILRQHLFDLNVIHKNKMKIVHIPDGTQLVEKGIHENGNKIFAFHLYHEQKIQIFTTSEITDKMLFIIIPNT